ncbi:MAG: FUSC family protein [Candidatus Nanopelagicales bacterium]
MAMRIHDPGHVALHRGVRAAVGVPIAMGLCLWLLPGTPAALIAAFGVLVTVAIADFGGMRIDQARAIGGMALAGFVVLTIGVVAGRSIWSAVLATFIVTATLSFIAVLHGSVASGAPAVMIMYVVSVSLGVPLTSLGPILAGWAIAMALALPIALFVMPRRTTAPVRQATAGALRALAGAAESRAAGQPLDIDALVKAESDLQHSYLGNPFRAAGFSLRAQTLLILVAQVQGLLAAFIRGHGYFSDLQRTPSTLRMVDATAATLRSAADALSTPDSPASVPSGIAVASSWEDQWQEARGMLATSSPAEAPTTVGTVLDMFPDRAFGLTSVRLTMLVRRVLGLPPEDYSPVLGEHTIPLPPVPDLWLELRSHANLRSPWGRLALRTGLGIAMAVLVVELMGLAHGFWVMLGVVSVLRFDSFTTIKTGALAIAGTMIGAIAGILVILVDDRNEPLMWVIFVVAVFLATWAPGALGFMLGQASFSLFVIIAFSLIAWPPDLTTVEQRVVDICVGALLSIVVALLMWPRGVMRGLLDNVADAVNAGAQLLTGAVHSLVAGPDAATAALPQEANSSLVRAREVVELTMSSTNPDVVARAFQWQALLDHLRTLMGAGHLMASWSYDRPPIDQYAAPMGPPLEEEASVVAAEWTSIADEVEGTPAPAAPVIPDTLAQLEAAASTLDLSAPDVADRTVAAVWGHGWLMVSRNAARAASAPMEGSTA